MALAVNRGRRQLGALVLSRRRARRRLRLASCRRILVVGFTNNCTVGSPCAWEGIWHRSSGSGLPDRDPLQQGEQVVLGEPPVEGPRLLVRQFLVQPDAQLQLS